MRTLLTTCLILAFSVPAFADETGGKILAFDRVANIIVLDDNTIWPLGPDTETTADLVAGDTVKIVYVGGGDNGVNSITSVLRTDS